MSPLRYLLILFIMFTAPSATFADSVWIKPLQPSTKSPLRFITATVGETPRLLVASKYEVFERTKKNDWALKWDLHNHSFIIHNILSFPNHPFILFVLTNRGLFAGHLLTQSWSQLFFGHSEIENDVTSFSIHPEFENFWVLGTHRGLFYSMDSGTTWKPSLTFGARAVEDILMLPETILITTDRFIFKTQDLSKFKEVYSFLRLSDEEIPEEEVSSLFRHKLVYSSDQQMLWVIGTRHLLTSRNLGDSWVPVTYIGMQGSTVFDLYYSTTLTQLYAATSDGVYTMNLNETKWQELYRGIDTKTAYQLTEFFSSGHHLSAITDSGIFELPFSVEPTPHAESPLISSSHKSLFHQMIRLEPSIQEVQKQVINYNDVHPGKIKRWQVASRLQALLPNLSFGRDYNEGNNIDLDRGSTSVPDRYIIGPQDISRGWDFDVSWDLGDFIWSSSQTSIDSRSKSLADLRRDLLSEAARLYHERRRLQVATLYQPIDSEPEYLEKLIRLDELTSLLDGLTGGYFSRSLTEIYYHFPELKSLWHENRSVVA